MTAPAVAVRTENLSKRYGALSAVADVSLEIPAGSVLGLIGPNGAGKTTTLNMLATLLAPTSGRVEVLGVDPSSDPTEVRRRMGYMPDQMGIYDDLRVDEYLAFFAAAYGVPAPERPALVEALLDLVDLGVKQETMVDDLSRGMKQRLSLARALVHDPDVLVLDEPASGLDPRARVEFKRLVSELHSMGKTLLISSHILPELEEVCTHIGVMEAGRLLAYGSPKEIRYQLAGGHTIRVRLAGGEEREYFVEDEDEQADLVRRLVVEEALPVVEVTERSGGLEDLFMKITKGVVQ